MRVSVCITTYNQEKYIEQAITSVLNQEVSFEYEIIIGEDCSTDLTEDVLRRLETSNPGRLKVIYRQNNVGAVENALSVIECCSGEYIAFLEGDDFWTSVKKLELQVQFLDKHQEASFCFHRTRYLFTNDQSSEYVLPLYDPPMLSGFDFLLQESNPVALSSIVARRAHITDLRVWLADLKLGDWPLCLMLAGRGRVGFIPMEMSKYRVHDGGNWSQLSGHLQFAYVMQMLFHVSRLLSGEEKRLVERRKAELADWWCNDVICNRRVQLDAVLHDLDHVGLCELSTYLFSHAVDRARGLQEQSALMNDQLRIAEDERASMRQTLIGTEEQLAASEQRRRASEDQLRCLKAQHASSEELLAFVLSTRSWRVTSPFRILCHILKRQAAKFMLTVGIKGIGTRMWNETRQAERMLRI